MVGNGRNPKQNWEIWVCSLNASEKFTLEAEHPIINSNFQTNTKSSSLQVLLYQEEEEELVMSMPEKPNWVRTHGDLRRGNLAFKHFTELEPMSSDRYKVAGSMFADAGENESATEIWKLIGEK
ncbi:hypothetical protein ACFXTH_005689 [Malus domestica]